MPDTFTCTMKEADESTSVPEVRLSLLKVMRGSKCIDAAEAQETSLTLKANLLALFMAGAEVCDDELFSTAGPLAELRLSVSSRACWPPFSIFHHSWLKEHACEMIIFFLT